jgi:iron-sulfur cluster assembly protein/iron-sulfur cluster insertion protein
MITITETAATKISALLATDGTPNMALRVAVRPGGCSGYSYEMYFDTLDHQEEPCTITNQHGVNVIVDNQSAVLLEQATLDYNDGLMDAGFKITNPGASRTCGCGQSFS